MYHPAAALLAGFYWFPESPYWLIREDKSDKARRAMRRLYGCHDPDFLDLEVRRLQKNVQSSARQQRGTEESNHTILRIAVGQGLQCFRGTNLKRTLTAMLAASAQQLIGAVFAIAYATYFFELIGVKDYFLTSCLLYVVMVVSTCAAFPLVEIVGRRALIVPSLFVLSGILVIMGICGCFPNSDVALWGIVVMMYIWALVYQVSIGASGFVLASEVTTLRLRATTQALVTAMNGVWGLVVQFAVPYMINPDAGNLGGKTAFVFVVTGLSAATAAYLLFPETKASDESNCVEKDID